MYDISDAIRYAGVDDTGRKMFESQYPLPSGMSYNSYVVSGSTTRRYSTVSTPNMATNGSTI